MISRPCEICGVDTPYFQEFFNASEKRKVWMFFCPKHTDALLGVLYDFVAECKEVNGYDQ